MLSADTDWNQFYLRICLQHISFTQSIGASQEVFRYRYKYLKMKSEHSEKALNHVPDRDLENMSFIVCLRESFPEIFTIKLNWASSW